MLKTKENYKATDHKKKLNTQVAISKIVRRIKYMTIIFAVANGVMQKDHSQSRKPPESIQRFKSFH